jgi:hypothetical protein
VLSCAGAETAQDSTVKAARAEIPNFICGLRLRRDRSLFCA